MPHSKTPGGAGASEKFLKQQAESKCSLSLLRTMLSFLLMHPQSTEKVHPMLVVILRARHQERHQYVLINLTPIQPEFGPRLIS